MTNTLAYYCQQLVAAVKGFIVQPLGWHKQKFLRKSYNHFKIKTVYLERSNNVCDKAMSVERDRLVIHNVNKKMTSFEG